MTADTLLTETPSTDAEMSDAVTPSVESGTPAATAQAPAEHEPMATPAKKSPVKKASATKTKTIQLTLTVTGTADGEWHAELKQGTTYLARNIAVAAAAVSRAANELHEDLSTPIHQIIEEARSHQAAKVSALEAELDAARKALAHLD